MNHSHSNGFKIDPGTTYVMVDIYMIKITFILSNNVSERTLNYNDQGVR